MADTPGLSTDHPRGRDLGPRRGGWRQAWSGGGHVRLRRCRRRPRRGSVPGDRRRPGLQRRDRNVTLESRHADVRRLDRDRRRQRRCGLRGRARLGRPSQSKCPDEQDARYCGREQAPAAPRCRPFAWPDRERAFHHCAMRRRSSQCGSPIARHRFRSGSRRRRSGCWPSRCSRSPPSAQPGCDRRSSESRECWGSLRPTPL